MTKSRTRRSWSASGLAAVLVALAVPAQAYTPTPEDLYRLPPDEQCLKGRGNCVVYPKSAQLPSGRIVASFERSVYPSSGSADGQTLPIWVSDDTGDSWTHLTDVAAPAYLSSDPEFAPYVSNWTNPYLYVLPQDVGDLQAGTLLLASVVTGEDEYVVEQKASDPDFVATQDGDRRDTAIALFASTDEGSSWSVVDIVVAGGWSSGRSEANTLDQNDPVWEPDIKVIDGELVVYFSDEREHTGYDPATGEAQLAPDWDSAPDPGLQILSHTVYDPTNDAWSAPVVDVAGATVTANGSRLIGGNRPGMTTIAEMSDGRWMLTFEYFGGGLHNRYKTADSPLRFFADGDDDGTPVSQLPTSPGTPPLADGGSPVLSQLPDGRVLYNSYGSSWIWVNDSASLDDEWTAYQTTIGSGYSRTLQYVEQTGQVLVLKAAFGQEGVSYAHVDLGDSVGAYHRLVNRATGQVIGTGGNETDANIGNGDTPDVRLEDYDSSDVDTQYWHVVTKGDGNRTLLNKAGGRAASIWTNSATEGQRIGQWVDDRDSGIWSLETTAGGDVRFRSTQNPDLYLTGAGPDAPLDLAPRTDDGSQEWELVELGETVADTTPPVVTAGVSGRVLTLRATDDGSGVASIEYRKEGASGWTGYDAPVEFKGRKTVVVDYRATDRAGNVSSTQKVTVTR